MSDTVCTGEELSLSVNSDGVAIVCLTRSQNIGLALAMLSGFISLLAVILAFVLIFVSYETYYL